MHSVSTTAALDEFGEAIAQGRFQFLPQVGTSRRVPGTDANFGHQTVGRAEELGRNFGVLVADDDGKLADGCCLHVPVALITNEVCGLGGVVERGFPVAGSPREGREDAVRHAEVKVARHRQLEDLLSGASGGGGVEVLQCVRECAGRAGL